MENEPMTTDSLQISIGRCGYMDLLPCRLCGYFNRQAVRKEKIGVIDNVKNAFLFSHVTSNICGVESNAKREVNEP